MNYYSRFYIVGLLIIEVGDVFPVIDLKIMSHFVHSRRTLNNSLDKCKRKYEAKVKRLENQLNDMSLNRSGRDLKAAPLPSPREVTEARNANPMSSSVTTTCKQRTHQKQQNVPETTL